MSFQIVSDLHVNKLGVPNLTPRVKFLIVAGDIGDPNLPSYDEFLKDVASKFECVYVVKGNHDYRNCDIEAPQVSSLKNIIYI